MTMSTSTAAKSLTSKEVKALSKKMGGGDKVKRKADVFPDPISVPGASLVPLFENNEKNHVWTVQGSFTMIPFIFSLTTTMTIHRSETNKELTLFNAFRCEESLEQEILALGKVTHVVKLGQFHGDADAYYVKAPQFGEPKLWTLPGGSVAKGTTADEIISSTNLPIPGAKLCMFTGHPFPEGLIILPCHRSMGGPLLVACDSLIHIPDLSIVSTMGRFLFSMMGFSLQTAPNVPKPAPLWFKQTIGAMGAACVRGWYQEVADMDWTCCVGGHGPPAKNCDHTAMLAAVEKQIPKK